MTQNTVKKMSVTGAIGTINEICLGMQRFVQSNPDSAKYLLEELVGSVLNTLEHDDFFGTEGWEHAFGMSD